MFPQKRSFNEKKVSMAEKSLSSWVCKVDVVVGKWGEECNFDDETINNEIRGEEINFADFNTISHV